MHTAPCRRRAGVLPLAACSALSTFSGPWLASQGDGTSSSPSSSSSSSVSSSVREGAPHFLEHFVSSLLSAEHRFNSLGDPEVGGGTEGRVLDLLPSFSSFSFCFWSHRLLSLFELLAAFLLLGQRSTLEILRSPWSISPTLPAP